MLDSELQEGPFGDIANQQHPLDTELPMFHGAYIGTLRLLECKKYVLYVIRKR